MYSLIITYIRQFLFPTFCAACKTFALEHKATLCQNCLAQIRPVVSQQLEISKAKLITVYAVGAYDQPLVSLILAKSSGKRTVAYQLGNLVWERSVLRHLAFDYLVPIPLHWTRYAWRGYNQANEIAKAISKQRGKPIRHLLWRIRRTSFQSYFKGDDRIENVKNVFELKSVNLSLYKNKHIVLVDDVMTSGATLKYAARELFKLNPASISVIVVCRVS